MVRLTPFLLLFPLLGAAAVAQCPLPGPLVAHPPAFAPFGTGYHPVSQGNAYVPSHLLTNQALNRAQAQNRGLHAAGPHSPPVRVVPWSGRVELNLHLDWALLSSQGLTGQYGPFSRCTLAFVFIDAPFSITGPSAYGALLNSDPVCELAIPPASWSYWLTTGGFSAQAEIRDVPGAFSQLAGTTWEFQVLYLLPAVAGQSYLAFATRPEIVPF